MFTTVFRAGAVIAATASALYGGGHVAQATTGFRAAPPADIQDDEPDHPPPGCGSHNGLVVIDNSHADSWLEVDRTLNTLIASKGTAGSDHDGGGGAIDVRTGDISGSDPVPGIGHPPWQGESGD